MLKLTNVWPTLKNHVQPDEAASTPLAWEATEDRTSRAASAQTTPGTHTGVTCTPARLLGNHYQEWPPWSETLKSSQKETSPLSPIVFVPSIHSPSKHDLQDTQWGQVGSHHAWAASGHQDFLSLNRKESKLSEDKNESCFTKTFILISIKIWCPCVCASSQCKFIFIVDCSQRSLKAAPSGEPARDRASPRLRFQSPVLGAPWRGYSETRAPVSFWRSNEVTSPGRRMGGCDSHPPSTKSETGPFSKLSHSAGKNETLRWERTSYTWGIGTRHSQYLRRTDAQGWETWANQAKPLHKRTRQAGPMGHELQSMWEVRIVPHLWKRLIINPGKT